MFLAQYVLVAWLLNHCFSIKVYFWYMLICDYYNLNRLKSGLITVLIIQYNKKILLELLV